MIVGADATTDAAVLATSAALYKDYGAAARLLLGLQPDPGSRARVLPLKAPPLQRENRLYQADWLLRFYGFTLDEIADERRGRHARSRRSIPKLAWALKNRERFPVDVNTADREMLLRVPGLGARAVDRIVAARRHTRLRLADVGRLARSVKRARALPDHRRLSPDRRARPTSDLRARLAAPPAAREPVLMQMRAHRRCRPAPISTASATPRGG